MARLQIVNGDASHFEFCGTEELDNADGMGAKTICQDLVANEELIRWKITNFKDCSKFFGKKNVIQSEPFESAGCIWELQLTASNVLGRKDSGRSGKSYRQWYRPYFNSVYYQQDSVEIPTACDCDIDWFTCDLNLLHSNKDQVRTVFHARIVGLADERSDQAPIYAPASPHSVSTRSNLRYKYCFKPKINYHNTGVSGKSETDDETNSSDSQEYPQHCAKILKANRDALFEQEAQCLKDGTLEIELNLEVLIEKKSVISRELSPSAQSQSFAQFLESGLFSDFTIVGKDDAELKVHKVMIANASPYFKSMLTSNMVESESNRICLNTEDPTTLRKMITFIYTQDPSCLVQTEISSGNIEELLDLLIISDKYQVTNMRDFIEKLLTSCMDFKTALRAFPVADAYHRAGLRSEAKHQLVVHMPRAINDGSSLINVVQSHADPPQESSREDEEAWVEFLAENPRLGWEVIKEFAKICRMGVQTGCEDKREMRNPCFPFRNEN